jgi:hypothetical protein
LIGEGSKIIREGIMSDWFYGSELLELWGIKDFELLKFVMEGTLQPYDKLLRPIIPPNIARIKEALQRVESELSHLPTYWENSSDIKTVRMRVANRQEYGDDYPSAKDELEAEIASLKASLPKKDEESWKEYEDSQSESALLSQREAILRYLFRREDTRKFANEHNLRIPAKTKSAQLAIDQLEKKLRPSQRDKIECGKIAVQKWKEDSSLTIGEVAECAEMNKQLENSSYTQKTIKGWIHTFCPNHKPGRRPTKKK